MNSNTRCFLQIVGIGSVLLMPLNAAFADSKSFNKLSADWVQWALSIPATENPTLDNTGEKCVVGQRGEMWLLAGVFSGGTATRTCAVPAGKPIFFPVVNSFQINSPDVCGEPPENKSVDSLRSAAAAFIDGVSDLLVEVDGKAINNLRRIQSQVFAVALPEDNLFVAPCAPLPVPAGIYSPAVDDGYYVKLTPLDEGPHSLRIRAENPSQGFHLDVTYNLTVIPVLKK